MKRLLFFTTIIIMLIAGNCFGGVSGYNLGAVGTPIPSDWFSSGRLVDYGTNALRNMETLVALGVNPGTGSIFYVDSGVTNEGDGSSWLNAVDTLDEGINLCTASRGDVIFVAQGHAETFVTQSLDCDVVGVTIVGCGTGSLKPTITYNHANAEVAIGADNVTIHNIRFLSSITDVLMGIEVEDGVGYFSISGCDFAVDAGGTDEFLECINFVNDNTGCSIRDCDFNMKGGLANAAVMLDADTDQLTIYGCDIRGDYAVACINGDTTLSTDLIISNCVLMNGISGVGGLNDQPAIEVLDGTGGIIAHNYIISDVATHLLMRVADDMIPIENWSTDVIGDDTQANDANTATITVSVDG